MLCLSEFANFYLQNSISVYKVHILFDREPVSYLTCFSTKERMRISVMFDWDINKLYLKKNGNETHTQKIVSTASFVNSRPKISPNSIWFPVWKFQ